MLEAFKIIHKKDPSLGLVIIGRNMQGDKILSKIRDAKAIFLGEQNRKIVLWFIKHAELIAQPSKIEGIPRVSLEALHLNKKVIFARCVPEFINSDPSFVAFDLDPLPLSQLIQHCILRDDYPRYDTNLHSIENVLTQYQELYL